MTNQPETQVTTEQALACAAYADRTTNYEAAILSAAAALQAALKVAYERSN